MIKAPLDFVLYHVKEAVIQECYDEGGALRSFLYWESPNPPRNGVVSTKAKKKSLV